MRVRRRRLGRLRRARGCLLAAGLLCGCGDEGPTGGGPPGELTYTLGAKFEPPAGRIVHGMGQWAEYNAKLMSALPDAQRPAAGLAFVDLGDTPRGWRPDAVAAALDAYDRAGQIPHFDLALRGLQLPRAVLDTLTDPFYAIDDEVTTTTKYDGRLRDLIDVVARFRKPVLLRIGGEFNGWWNGYHPYTYPQAFRKIVGMFRQAGVENVAFIWCYQPAAPDDFDERDAAGEYKWYPGADAIDWYAIDWFDAADFTGPLVAGRGRTARGRSERFLDMAAAERKPVLIAESAPVRYDLSDPARAQSAWADWFEPFFRMLAERPEIVWFHLISYDWTQSSYYRESGWRNNDLTASPWILEKLITELAKARYLHAAEKTLLKEYARYR